MQRTADDAAIRRRSAKRRPAKTRLVFDVLVTDIRA